MEPFRDYISKKELGIRIKEQKSCRVVRKFKGEWIEFGPEYTLPVDRELLEWSPPGIPASTLAVALKIYELENLWADLRSVVLGEAAVDSSPIPGREDNIRKDRHTGGLAPGKPRQAGTVFRIHQRAVGRTN